MYIRIALICAMIHTTAAAETISTLTLDWNEDGFEDTARLDRSHIAESRADLLLFEGGVDGQELVEVAADFARAPTHPNMKLLLLAGASGNRLEIVEEGTIFGSALWFSKTNLRYADGSFFVDAKVTHQTSAFFSDAEDISCFVGLRDKLISVGSDGNEDVLTTDMEPIPLMFWTTSTFATLLQDLIDYGCTEDEYRYEYYRRVNGYFLEELSLDWNGDGYLDHVALVDTYPDYSLAVFMGDATGSSRMTWLGRNLRPIQPQKLELRSPPGRQGVVELSLFGAADSDSGFRNDVMTRFSWQEDEPIVSGFAVWQTHQDSGSGINCEWDFLRGQQINVYSNAWFDDPEYGDPYTFADWQNVSLSEIIGTCRP